MKNAIAMGNYRALISSVAVSRTGQLAVVWQDARFSNGARDAIAGYDTADRLDGLAGDDHRQRATRPARARPT